MDVGAGVKSGGAVASLNALGTGSRKLTPTVVFCSSEEQHFPVSELSRPVPSSRGWHSAKHCPYPQQIGLRFEGDMFVEQLQVLAHESKIPSRVEVFVSDPPPSDGHTRVFPPYETSAFQRLGYLSFHRNDEASFKSGELRCVRVDCRVLYFKLLVWEPHENVLNFYQQVGLCSIACVGRLNEVYQPSSAFPHPRHVLAGGSVAVLGPGSQQVGRLPQQPLVGAPMTALDALQLDLAYDPVIIGKIRELTVMKERAATEENYEQARIFKQQIEAMYPIGAQLRQLELRKKQATLEEDYQLAHVLKADIDELRSSAVALRVGIGGGNVVLQLPSSSSANVVHPTFKAGSDDRPVAGGGGFGGDPQQGNTPQYPPQFTPAVRLTFSNGVGDYSAETSNSPARQYRPHVLGSSSPAQRRVVGPSAFDEKPAVATGRAVVPASEYGSAVQDTRPGGGVGGGATRQTTVQERDLVHFDQEMATFIRNAVPNEAPPEDISSSSDGFITGLGDMIAAFGLYATSCLFSKNYPLREAAVVVLTEKAADVLTQVSPNDVVRAMVVFLGNKGHGVTDSVPAVVLASCEMLRAMCAGGVGEGNVAAAFNESGLPVIDALVARLGDSNARVRGVCSEMLLQLARVCGASGPETVASAAIAGRNVGKNPNFRLVSGRLGVIGEIITNVLRGRSDPNRQPSLRLETVMASLVTPALTHSHNEARDAGFDLMCVLWGALGEAALTPYVSKLKPSQKKHFDERFARFDASGGLSRQQPADTPAATNAHASERVGQPRARRRIEEAQLHSDDASHGHTAAADDDGRRTPSPSPPAKPSVARRKIERVRQDADHHHHHHRQEQQPLRRLPPKPIPGECQFCGVGDEAFFDHDELVQHFMSECPMLCTCPLCHLPVEIREVHWHMTADCEHRGKLRQCPRCLEGVRAEEFDEHVARKQCIQHGEEYLVCPLCHERMPNLDSFWKNHITAPPFCSGNPRTADS